jgi:hypothetical protein
MKLNKSVLTLLGSCALITLLTGCASMICGPRQSISISSKPAGAEVLVYDPHGEIVFQNTTPCVASLIRSTPEVERANYIILIRKEGYAPVQIPLTSRINKAYLANVLNGGIGLIVDSFAGTMWTLSAEGLDPKLVDQSAAIVHEDNDLMISLRQQVAGGLLAHLEPVQNQPIPLESLTRVVRASGQ